ncbi:hypothetical protein Tco_0724947 [Tanacetum coccineum]|uniref:Uncharacterized protein n=1 Tax=Tanacetum coccineum TaxID=301880 RepID=A0ABQ4YCI8_9ASTR
MALVYEHLAAEEIEKLVEDPENEKEEETTKDTEVEPDKDTPMVDITNIVPPVNVDDEEDEIADEVFELRRRVKGKHVEETRISPIPSPTRSPRNLSTLVSSDTEKLQELMVTHPTPSSGSSELKITKTNHLLSMIKAKPNRFKRYKSFFHELQGRYGYLFAHLKKRFMPWTSSNQLADNLHDVMMEMLPSLVKEKVTDQVKKEVPAQVRDQVLVYPAEGLILERKMTKEETERLISKAILQERGRMQAQISSQIQNIINNAIPSLVDAFVGSYMSGHILHVHLAQVQSSSVLEQQHQLYLAMKADPLLQQQDIAIGLALQMKFEKSQVPQTACRYSAIRTRDQDDPHDDAHPEGENSAKRQKTSEYEAYVSGESSGDSIVLDKIYVEEPVHSTTAKLKKHGERDAKTKIKEILVSPHPRKITPLVQSCQRDPEAPTLSLINQDLLYLKKGNSGPEKIVLSLHKFPAIVFNDDDIEERTSRWVNKDCGKIELMNFIVSITEQITENLNKKTLKTLYADRNNKIEVRIELSEIKWRRWNVRKWKPLGTKRERPNNPTLRGRLLRIRLTLHRSVVIDTQFTNETTTRPEYTKRHGELITIFGAVVKPTLDELLALWLSYSWIYDALAIRGRPWGAYFNSAVDGLSWSAVSVSVSADALKVFSDLELGSVVTVLGCQSFSKVK